jgi:hypothetical protein
VIPWKKEGVRGEVAIVGECWIGERVEGKTIKV